MKSRIALRRFRKSDLALVTAWAGQKEVWEATVIGDFRPLSSEDQGMKDWFAGNLLHNLNRNIDGVQRKWIMNELKEMPGMSFQGPYHANGARYEKQVVLAYCKDSRKAGIACFLTGPVPEGVERGLFREYVHPELKQTVLCHSVGLPICPNVGMLNSGIEYSKNKAREKPSVQQDTVAFNGRASLLTTVAEIPSLLKGRFAIFTGAGLSTAAGISDMKTLHADLGMDFSTRDGKDNLFLRIMESPDLVLGVVDRFLGNFYFGRPTQAHLAIKAIQDALGIAVLTENEDQLHQICNTATLTRRDSEGVETALQSADILLVLGIGRNEPPASRFFARFRSAGPNRRIIAINRERPDPSYLGEQDFILQEDLKKAVPRLRDLLLEAFPGQGM